MSLFGRINRFARSPQGRRLANQAVELAKKPENRRKASQLASRLRGRPRTR
jgi:hypothetical protein